MSFKLLQLEQNRAVARKLYIATGIMFTFPFLIYFISFYFIFHNKEFPESWSGGMAVAAANIVVFGYVWSAFHEDDDEDDNDGEEKRKFDNDASKPRVGAFKQRTD